MNDIGEYVPAPTQYLAPPDATLEFQQKLNDPARWIVKTGVPLFKAHERTDPNTKALIRVDLPKLHRIAANMQRLEKQSGVPIRLTLGHTEPGKPETEQPPVGGYYRNARVAPFGPKGEPAVVADEWLDPQYAPVRKNFPYRSAEYYDDAEQITGVALLTRDPYLDLGVVAYERDDALVCYTDESKTPTQYNRTTGRKPVLYQLVIGETPPTNYGGPTMPAAPYSAPWPGPAYKKHQIGHQHASGGAIYGSPQYPSGYGAMDALGGAAMGARMGSMAGPVGAGVGAVAGGAMGAMSGGSEHNSRYANCGPGGQMPPPMHQGHHMPEHMRPHEYGRQPGRYAGEGPADGPPPGAGGPPGDPIEQLQMLLTAAVELLGQIGGGGGAGGPPAPTAPFPEEDEATMASRYGRRGGYYGRQQPRRYASPAAPTAYGAPPAPAAYPEPAAAPVPPAAPTYPPDARTITGRPVGAALRESQLQYKLQQQDQAIKMLMYERDAADTAECVAEIQRLADQGYSVTEYEIGELKAKPRSQRAAYLQHIATHYQKIGTEQLPPLLGDPTPAGPDPNAGRPATKEEMEAAVRLTNQNPQLNYSAALEQVRYGGAQPDLGPVNRLANTPYGAPTGPADDYPQYGSFAAPSANGNGRY